MMNGEIIQVINEEISNVAGKPPQESRRPRAPAFTFGQKLEVPGGGKAGPGPASYNTEGMTAKGELERYSHVKFLFHFNQTYTEALIRRHGTKKRLFSLLTQRVNIFMTQKLTLTIQ